MEMLCFSENENRTTRVFQSDLIHVFSPQAILVAETFQGVGKGIA
jgi:hypothetical protein